MNNMFYFMRFPIGLWMLGLSFSAQFSSVMWVKLGGATVTCILMVVAMFLCRGKDCRNGFWSEMQKTARLNNNIIVLLTLYYIMVVISWFHAPYEVKYNEWSFIWKQHVMDILEFMVVFYMCQNPRRIRLFLWICLVANLITFYKFKSASDYYGIAEARGFLGDEYGGALGSSSSWEAVVMFVVAFAGYLMTERNKLLRIIGFSCLSVFPYFILKAGFGVPVFVGLMGLAVVGFVHFKYGKKKNAAVRLFVLMAVMVAVIVTFFRIAHMAETGSEEQSVAVRAAGLVDDFRTRGQATHEDSYGVSRTKLMHKGWRSFLKSPLFGMGGPFPSKEGIVANDHQAITDYLAHFGLVGGGAFIAFVFFCISYTVKRYKIHQTWQDAAAVGVAVIFLLGGVFNPTWYSCPLQSMLIFCLPFKTKEMYSLTGKPACPQYPIVVNRQW